MRKIFQVAEPPHNPRWLLAIVAGLPMVAVLVLAFSHVGRRQLPMPIAAAIALVCVVVFIVLDRAAKRRAIMLDDGILDVFATFYRRRVAVQELDLDKSRVIDLRERSEWRPWMKTNAYAMPGLSAGWFRSRNWMRLFCLVTDRHRVLLLPLRAGGALLLSAAKPIELLVALRAVDDVQRGRR